MAGLSEGKEKISRQGPCSHVHSQGRLLDPMREYCFPYREELSETFGRIPRPAVEIFLRARTGPWFRVFAYADSGADFSLFPKGVCKLLGLELNAGERSLIQGVSGKPGVVYMQKVEMRLGEAS